jgi:cytochrome c
MHHPKMHTPRWLLAMLISLGCLHGLPASAGENENGKEEFEEACNVCHSLEPGKTRVGPSLAGVVGRKAGSLPGFAYSEAMKNSGLTWTPEVLDTYLTAPAKLLPGVTMAFPGEADATMRKALIEYLATVR